MAENWQTVGQKFIFDVPAEAALDMRGCSLRVTVKSKTTIQLNRFLGQTDVHLSGLRDENEVQGWFPLQPETSTFKTAVTTGIITGSIKLRLQYIHSNYGLTTYFCGIQQKRLDGKEVLFSVCHRWSQNHMAVFRAEGIQGNSIRTIRVNEKSIWNDQRRC